MTNILVILNCLELRLPYFLKVKPRNNSSLLSYYNEAKESDGRTEKRAFKSELNRKAIQPDYSSDPFKKGA